MEYFLFLRKSDRSMINYTTFPNINLCLAIYKENVVNYTSNVATNQCTIETGSKSFTSRMYGFHTMPFNVNINTDLDQICIVFHPAALRAFTGENLNEALSSSTAFEQLFGTHDFYTIEHIFEETNAKVRAEKLEEILLSRLSNNVPPKLQEALHYINLANTTKSALSIEILCKKLNISDTTLFRLFKNHVGQNAQQFLKTIRFRNVLAGILEQKNSLTELGFSNHYYDQPHFIKDFKAFAGQSPKGLVKQISVQQKDLAWIYKEVVDE